MQTFLSKTGYQLTDHNHDAKVCLQKQVRGSVVEVSFRPAIYVPEEVTENSPEMRKEVEEESGVGKLAFQVTISQGKEALVFDCEAGLTDWSIQEVSLSSQSQQTYTAEALQDSALQYLQVYGVDDPFVAFLRSYAKDKEQRMYRHWLEQMADFFA